MIKHISPALRLTAVCLFLFVVLYTLLITGVAQVASPANGEAELITVNGKPVGAALVGQAFTQDGYFWGRPSAVDYNGGGSAGSNKGPTNPDYLTTVQSRIDTFILHNPGVKASDIPSDLVTASSSGLDPHISPTAALIQVPRIAKARNVSDSQLRMLVLENTEGPWLGLFGTSTVHVLKLNIALDQNTP